MCIIVAGIILVVIAVQSPYKPAITTPTVIDTIPVSTATDVNALNDRFKNNFMTNCIGGKANYAYCSCAYNKLVEKNGLSGFVNISDEYDKTGKLPDGTVETIAVCFNQL